MKLETLIFDAQLAAWDDFVWYLNARKFAILKDLVDNPSTTLASRFTSVTRDYWYSYRHAIRQCYATYLNIIRTAETDPQWVVSFARETKRHNTPIAVSYRVVAAEQLGVVV